MNKNGWTYKKLGEVCEYAKTRINSRDISIENYIGVDNLLQNCQGRSLATKVPDGLGLTEYWEGDVLIGNIRPYLRKIWLADCRGGCNGDVLAIRRKHEYTSLIDTSFLYKCLSTNYFFDFAMQYAKGEKMPRGDKKEILNYLIPIPTIAEQERIVAELDLLSGIIEKKKEQLKAYDQLAQSIFYTMFGDPIDNPKGWETKKLGEVCDFINGFAFKSDLFKDNGLPILRISNIQNNVVNEEGMVYFSPTDYKEDFTKYSVNKGDIVIAMSGATTGKLGVYLGERTCYLNQRVGKFQVKSEDRITNKLLLFYLRTISKQILTDAMGVAQPNISSRQIKEYTIILPPLSLQEEFADKVEEIERQKALVQQSIEETQTMFDYTMDKYFG